MICCLGWHTWSEWYESPESVVSNRALGIAALTYPLWEYRRFCGACYRVQYRTLTLMGYGPKRSHSIYTKAVNKALSVALTSVNKTP